MEKQYAVENCGLYSHYLVFNEAFSLKIWYFLQMPSFTCCYRNSAEMQKKSRYAVCV